MHCVKNDESNLNEHFKGKKQKNNKQNLKISDFQDKIKFN